MNKQLVERGKIIDLLIQAGWAHEHQGDAADGHPYGDAGYYRHPDSTMVVCVHRLPELSVMRHTDTMTQRLLVVAIEQAEICQQILRTLGVLGEEE